MSNKKLSKALTWDELAKEYNSCHNGRSAQILPMNTVFEWAASNTDEYHVKKKEGTIHKIL